jgi:integrase
MQSKTKDTKIKYYDRALNLMNKALRECIDEQHDYAQYKENIKNSKNIDIECLSLKHTAVWAVKKWSHTLLSSSWRQYRASLIFLANLHYDKKIISETQFEKIKKLLTLTKGSTKEEIGETRTSAKKKKSINPEEIRLINDYLVTSKNQWSGALRIWISAGCLTGLRPIEWKTATIDNDTSTIVVQNAKATNGRSIGKTRTIDISHLTETERKDVDNQISIVNTINQKALWKQYYEGCSNLLKYSSRKLFPSKKKHPTLYSCRHQFSANMKASGCSRREVAALMGHISDLTAQAHYGKKIHGTKGIKPIVNALDINKVKIGKKESFKFDKRNK